MQIDLHSIPVPPPFNPLYRPGLGEAVSKQYAEYCEMHPHATQAERKAEYARIHDALRPSFPAIGEP